MTEDEPVSTMQESRPLASSNITLSSDTTAFIALWSSDVYVADLMTINIPAGKYTSESLSSLLNSRQPLVLIDRFDERLLKSAYQVWFDSRTSRQYPIIAKRLSATSPGSYTISFEAEPSVISCLGIQGVSSRLSTAFIQLPIGSSIIYKYMI